MSNTVPLEPGTIVSTPGTPDYVVGEAGGTLPVPAGFVLNRRLPDPRTSAWEETRVVYNARQPFACKMVCKNTTTRTGTYKVESVSMPMFGQKRGDGVVTYKTGSMTLNVREDSL